MKILKIFLLLSSLFLFVNADDHKYEHSYKSLEYLELDNTQLKQMKVILIEYKHKYKDFYEYKEDQEKNLENIMKAEKFDKNMYLEILKEIRTKASILESEKMEKIHNILNNEQRKRFAKYLEEWEVE
jgi:periplasmic protein CpxP/Spy